MLFVYFGHYFTKLKTKIIVSSMIHFNYFTDDKDLLANDGDPDLISPEFNPYFKNIVPKLAKIIKPSKRNFKMTNKSNIDSCYFTPVTFNAIINLIHSLNKIKSGKDKITSEILKKNDKYSINPLLLVMNCILSIGVFPCIVKNANCLN